MQRILLHTGHGDADMDMQNNVDSHSAGVAFGLISLSAGFAVMSAFLPMLDRTSLLSFKLSQSKLFLSSTLSFSAGVVTFFSLNHILVDSSEMLKNAMNKTVAMYADSISMTLFLGTILICMLIKYLVVKFFPKFASHHHHEDQDESDAAGRPSEAVQISAPSADHVALSTPTGQQDSSLTEQDRHSLQTGALGVTIALALHNIPEGLLLFLTTYTSPSIGAGIAFGLLFHKIPEGFVIALPYYASSRKAFLSLALVLFAEVLCLFIGGLIGYGIVANTKTIDTGMWGLLLSITAGILIYISAAGLMPRAYKLDAEDKVRTKAFFTGISIIVISIIILTASGTSHH